MRPDCVLTRESVPPSTAPVNPLRSPRKPSSWYGGRATGLVRHTLGFRRRTSRCALCSRVHCHTSPVTTRSVPVESPPVLHPVTGTVASRSDGGGVVHHHRARPLPVLCGGICVSLLQNCPKLVDYYIRSNPRLTHPEAKARRVSIHFWCSCFAVNPRAPSGALSVRFVALSFRPAR